MVFALLAIPVEAIELDESEINSTSELFGNIVDSFNNQEGTIRGIIKYFIGSIVLGVAVYIGIVALINAGKGHAGKKTGNAGLQNEGLVGNATLLIGVIGAVMVIVIAFSLLNSLGK